MARPTKYGPEIEKRIIEALSAGASRRAAAQYAGIDETTLIHWMKRYSNFASAVIAAESRVEVSAIVAVRKAWMDGDWRAAIEFLKRRRSSEWGETQRIEIIQSVREMARAANQDEEAAVAEAEQILREIRGSRNARS